MYSNMAKMTKAVGKKVSTKVPSPKMTKNPLFKVVKK